MYIIYFIDYMLFENNENNNFDNNENDDEQSEKIENSNNTEKTKYSRIKSRKALKTENKLKQLKQEKNGNNLEENDNLDENLFDTNIFYKINIRIAKRNSRKHITTIENIPINKFNNEEKTEKFLVKLRNAISSRATLKNKTTEPIIEVSGNKIDNMIPIICDFCQCKIADVIIHGAI